MIDALPEKEDVPPLEAAARFLAEGNVDAALGVVFAAWSDRPEDTDLAISYATLLARADREREAEDLFSSLADESPGDSRVWNNWGYLLLTRGEADLALVKLNRALELSPGDFEATVNAGIALDRLDRLDEAIDHYQQAVTLNPGSSVVFNNLGASLWRAGRIAEAREAFRQALALNPRDPGAANNMGVLKMASGEYDDAEGFFRQALKTEPEGGAAKRNLAEVRRRKRKSGTISESGKKCQEKPPSLF
ncbi:MAG: tetratricopeptide repeat protein [Planctomycetota bacterium]|nr:tetratricopeptide repeat protein [Planctomycetota bacterium]